jgi:uncharacterized protein
MRQFNLFKSERHDEYYYYFNLTSNNNEVVLSSQTYTSAESALKGIESVKKNVLNDNNFKRLEAQNGCFYFNLKASNGKNIGVSQMYKTEQAREKGIVSVKKNAIKAEVSNKNMSLSKYKNDKKYIL